MTMLQPPLPALLFPNHEPPRRRIARVVHLSSLICGLAFLAPALAACSDAFEQSGPSDIVLSGKLCVPAQNACPSSDLLQRGSQVGANQLDFRLQNSGAAAEFAVVATIEASQQHDAGPQDANPLAADLLDAADITQPAPDSPTDPGSREPIILVSRTYQLGAGESVSDRFVSRELLTYSTFQLTLDCAGCQGTLEYTLAADALECRSDDDCSGTWACSRSDGRCVECLKNADCSPSQSCDLGTQTCTPPDAAGCTTSAGGRATPPDPAAWLVGFALALGLLALRRRAWRPHARILMIFSALLLATWAAQAHAAPPSAALQLGVGPRILTGKLGDDTQRGIGLSVAQEVRGRFVGGRVSLGTSYYLTTQDAPPLSRELQLYSVAIGPQFYLPVEPVEISLGADLRHVGIVTNSLARLTGPSLNFVSAGATLQVRHQFSSFIVMLDAGYHPIFELESALLSLNLSVGLATD